MLRWLLGSRATAPASEEQKASGDDDPAYRPRFFGLTTTAPTAEEAFSFEPCDESPSDCDSLTTSEALEAPPLEPPTPPPAPAQPPAASEAASDLAADTVVTAADAVEPGFLGKLYASVRWLMGVASSLGSDAEVVSDPGSESSSNAADPEDVVAAAAPPPLPAAAAAPPQPSPPPAAASVLTETGTTDTTPQPAPSAEGGGDTMLLQRILQELAQTREMISSLAIARGVATDASSPQPPPPPPPLPPPLPPMQSGLRKSQLDELAAKAEKAQFVQHLCEGIVAVLKQAPTIDDAENIARKFVDAVQDADSRCVSALVSSYPATLRRFAAADPHEALRRVTRAEQIVFGGVPRDALVEARQRHRREVDRITSEAADNAELEQRCAALVAKVTKLDNLKRARVNMMQQLTQRLEEIKRKHEGGSDDSTS